MISASLLGGRCRSNLSPETTVPSLDPACCEPNSTASLQEGEVPERGELGERARAREERERKGERNVREVGKKVTLQRVGALQGTYVGTRPAESTVTASASSSSAARRRSEPTDRMPSTPSARPPLLLERAFYDKGDRYIEASARAGRLRRAGRTQVPESAPPQCDSAKPYARHATGCQATHSSGETQRATQQRIQFLGVGVGPGTVSVPRPVPGARRESTIERTRGVFMRTQRPADGLQYASAHRCAPHRRRDSV